MHGFSPAALKALFLQAGLWWPSRSGLAGHCLLPRKSLLLAQRMLMLLHVIKLSCMPRNASVGNCLSDVQIQMRRLPKPVIAMVAGYAVGGGHILHLVSDLTVSHGRLLSCQNAICKPHGGLSLLRKVACSCPKKMSHLIKASTASKESLSLPASCLACLTLHVMSELNAKQL